MKYFIFIVSTIISVHTALTMNMDSSDLTIMQDHHDSKPHIIIVNKSHQEGVPLLINKDIHIYNKNIAIASQDQKYDRKKSIIRISPNESTTIFPHTDLTLPEKKRFGMNNAGDAATLNVVLNASNESVYLNIGKDYAIQFGDVVYIYSAKKIIFERNNKTYQLGS